MSGSRDQVGRLLALVPYIQNRTEVPLQEVAARFGITPAQLVKDLKVLWYCGLPGLGMGDLIDVDMDAVEGDGMVRVSNADYLTRPLRLGGAEASALIVALRTMRDSADPAVREVVDRTLAKLQGAAEDGASLADRVDVQVSPDAAESARTRARIEGALTRRTQLSIDYYVPTRDETTQRVVDPLALVTTEGRDYLDAWCHLAEGQRLFRLDRINALEELETAVAVPEDVAPRDLSEGLFQPSPDDVAVTLRLSPGARWVADYYPVDSVREAGGGVLEVTLKVGDPAWLTKLLLRLVPHAQVVEPQEFSRRVHDAASEALRNYQ